MVESTYYGTLFVATAPPPARGLPSILVLEYGLRPRTSTNVYGINIAPDLISFRATSDGRTTSWIPPWRLSRFLFTGSWFFFPSAPTGIGLWAPVKSPITSSPTTKEWDGVGVGLLHVVSACTIQQLWAGRAHHLALSLIHLLSGKELFQVTFSNPGLAWVGQLRNAWSWPFAKWADTALLTIYTILGFAYPHITNIFVLAL